MTGITRKAAAALGAVLAAAGMAAPSACQAPPAPSPTAPPRIEVDSIGFDFAVFGGRQQLPSVTWNGVPGATMGSCPSNTYPGCVPAVDDLHALIAKGQLRKAVIELGTNDAIGGWTQAKTDLWTVALGQLPAGSCATVVLPYVVAPADTAAVAKARTAIAAVAAKLPRVGTIDWRDYVTPGVLGADGIHPAFGSDGKPVPAAMTAWRTMALDALELCQAGS